jgi:hypothetical protein
MDENHENMYPLVRGDQFTGLCIAGDTDQLYRFEIENRQVQICQTWQEQSAAISFLNLAFQMSGPVRFRIDVQVPEDCRNACVTLNGQMLIGWFAPDPPENLPGIVASACQDSGTPVSTLRPGCFQSINFRWQDQDQLRFYWVH